VAKKFPDEEKYRLSDQMIRASRSITANIAEGYGRYHYRDNIRFCRQSRGSLFELFDHIEAAAECGYMSKEEHTYLNGKLEELLILLNGYMRYLGKKKLSGDSEV
jgi:four helix bundle protein